MSTTLELDPERVYQAIERGVCNAFRQRFAGVTPINDAVPAPREAPFDNDTPIKKGRCDTALEGVKHE